MGMYINHPTMDKATWLEKHGARISRYRFLLFNDADRDHVAVCLVDNVAFTAAAIAFSPNERTQCADTTDDPRRRCYYILPSSRLREVGYEYKDVEKYREYE